MAMNGNDFEIRGRSRTPRAWLIFGLSMWGLFGSVLMVSVAGLAINLAQGQVDEGWFSIDVVLVAVGAVAALRCAVKCLGLVHQLSVDRDIAP